MNQHVETFFKQVEERLPKDNLLSPKNLVEAGMVKSESTLHRWRKEGHGPPYLQLSPGQVKYPRVPALEWFKSTYQPHFPFMYANTEEKAS
jgi:hypothetical protein